MIKNEIKIADDWAKFEELLAKLNKLAEVKKTMDFILDDWKDPNGYIDSRFIDGEDKEVKARALARSANKLIINYIEED